MSDEPPNADEVELSILQPITRGELLSYLSFLRANGQSELAGAVEDRARRDQLLPANG